MAEDTKQEMKEKTMDVQEDEEEIEIGRAHV